MKTDTLLLGRGSFAVARTFDDRALDRTAGPLNPLAPGSAPNGDLSWPLERAARLYGEKTALIDGGRSVTYTQLSRRVGGLGFALEELGVARGGRLGVLAPNSLAHAEWWLGVPAFGRVLVDLNTRLTLEELTFMIDDSAVEVLLLDDQRLELGDALRERCPSLRVLVHTGPGACPEGWLAHEELIAGLAASPPGLDERELATISYTGGTTGLPKGVMLSHGNLLANARHNLVATGHRHDDRFLHIPPMFHVAGTSNLFAATWVGATQVILPRFDANVVAETIERERITHAVLVPTMLDTLLRVLDERPTDLSSLRNLQYAASPISPELQRRALERFECELAQFYGMTETAPTVTHCTPEDHRRGAAGEEPYETRLRSIGAPVPGVQVQVRGEDGAELPAQEIGEVWVRGPNVMLGYWRRPEATEAALVDGWYRSGDAAYADSDGYLYMVDRLKDMIISGGENVYSVEVESALVEHVSVLEAAVFGVPDAHWGEAVHAVAVVRDGEDVSVADLTAHCRRRLAGFKVPRSIELRTAALPKSGAGKVLKRELRDPHWSGQARRVN
jgi:long-chain acyl-CoA synthetase